MISAIVPTLNSAATLPACLEALREADEIVVVDGGSTDATRQIAEDWPVRIFGGPRCRGAQLREGAEAAWCEWLLFVDADVVLASGWRAVVERHIAALPGRAASFRFRLDEDAGWARGVEFAVGRLGLPLGEEGLLISRKLYDAVGGFRPVRSLEYADLRRRIGRDRTTRLEASATASGDCWRRDGLRRLTSLILAHAADKMRLPGWVLARLGPK